MKRRVMHVIALVLVAAMMLSSYKPAKAQSLECVDYGERVMALMEEIKRDFGTECTWTDDMEVHCSYPIFHADGSLYAVVFEFKAGEENAGFAEYVCEENIIKAFSFTGRSALTAMLEYRGLRTEDYATEGNERLYYAGGYDYAVESDGSFYCINSGNVIASSEEFISLAREYETETIAVEQMYGEDGVVSPQAVLSSTHTCLTEAERSTMLPVIMSDFNSIGGTSYTNHCTPTAGVNWARFWRYLGGKTALFNGSNTSTFTSIHQYMGTTNAAGTTFVMYLQDNGYNGLCMYATNRGVSYTSSSISWAPSYNTIKTKINNGCPGLLSLVNYSGSTGYHSVFCTGYNSSNKLQILDGWTRGFTYINSTAYTMKLYSQVSFN